MMKRMIQITFILALVSVAGCSTSKAVYRSNATLSPTQEAGQYEVAIVIEDVTIPSAPRVMSAPKLRLLEGEKGTLSCVWSGRGLFCTAVVDDTSGKPQAKTSVVIKRLGETIWSKEEVVPLVQ